ncbi:hypothetical protein I8J29_29355 [Paenibacillus sp. MWE-103]|uniref:Uncharacterized protein n=1 Tax=Paenibacillus artemisiicola TaxID=1172618 RepID=A0ABS3WIZ3_9BACL|nr:hypothetical protein [Paenibacillus artemisiicola]MBO7748299.1 hypothetical protein [Paenibacillus artemisiicola]
MLQGEEEEGIPGPAIRRKAKQPSLGRLLLLLAVAAAIVAVSFALAHLLVGEAFDRLTD